MADETKPLAESSSRGADDPHPAGTQFGRYVIVRNVGSGGAGAVYEAFDPHLDRKVALKLLHARWDEGETGWKTLLAEARTLARLKHPNVVTVHDVGHHQGKVFVAMELVEGSDLAAWLAATSRSTEAIIDVFSRAGRGLEAAHAADIVHRDFKPRNVLVCKAAAGYLDVKVGDFGLAAAPQLRNVPTTDEERQPSDAVGESDVSIPEPPRRASVTGSRTDLGGPLVGTPAYMAPEQHEGEPVDARSDQFAYCVSLWEALTGQRPYVGTLFALAEAKLVGPPAWPKDDATPRWLVEIVLRGLSARPDERWPSMTALLARIEAGDPRRAARRRAAFALGGVSLVGVGVLLAPTGDDAAPRCTGAQAEIERVWDAERRQHVDDAMRAVPSSLASSTSPRVVAGIDAYLQHWADAHRSSCEATARGERSDAALDATMTCLRWRLGAMDGLVEVFEHADPDVLAHAVQAVAELPRVEACHDARTAAEGVQPPNESDEAEVEAIRTVLAKIDAVASAGRHAEARAQLEAVIPRAAALEYPPLSAELDLARGRLLVDEGAYQDAVENLQHAYAAGLRTNQLDLVTDAAIDLVGTLANDLEDSNEALRWTDTAVPLAERAGVATRQRARLRLAHAAALRLAGRYDEAIAEIESARTTLDAIAPEDRLHESALVVLGHVLMAKSEPERALEVFERAKNEAEQQLGAEHPVVAKRIGDIGWAYAVLDRPTESIVALRDALARLEAAVGPEHADVIRMQLNLAAGLGGLDTEDHTDEAIALIEDAKQKSIEIYGADSIKLYRPLVNLSALYKVKRQPEKALALIEEALALQERVRGPNHPDVCATLLNLASVHQWMGNRDETEQTYQRMLALAREHFESPHRHIADALLGLANLRLGQKRLDEALKFYEEASAQFEGLGEAGRGRVTMITAGRALALEEMGRRDEAGALYYQAAERGFVGANLMPWERAMISLRAGQWLWTVRDQHEDGEAKAVALVQQSIPPAREAGDWGEQELREAEAWLRKRGRAPDPEPGGD